MANSSLPNYMDKTSLYNAYWNAGGGGVQVIDPINPNNEVANFMSTMDLLQGIECSPYQFMDTVDARYTNKNRTYGVGSIGNSKFVGQKYAQKIMTQMPLVFFAPCEPVFMQDGSDNDANRLLDALITGDGSSLEFVMDKTAQYYGVQYAYADYYDYVNLMLSSIAYYLDIQDKVININGSATKISNVNWANATNSYFKTFFSAKENVIFFADNLTSISTSFSNNTTQSSLASQINGFSDQINELQFLLGGDSSAASTLLETAGETTSSITSALSSVLGNLGGGLVSSLADKGVNTVLNGGKIAFPEIWSDSSHDESYSLNFKLRSPDHDSLSIFLNILKPYVLLLAMTMPRNIPNNPNGYRSPFLVKCFSKGLFNINMGIIESMSVEKGDECQWNDDGLPTQMDISISIKNLYSHLAMSGYKEGTSAIFTNSQFQDFLANTAGMNVIQFNANAYNKINYQAYNLVEGAKNIVSRRFNTLSNDITNIIARTIGSIGF